jgi:hypothetical protein
MDTQTAALALALTALAGAVWALFLAAYPRIDHLSSKRVHQLQLELAELRDLCEQLSLTVKKMAARQYMRGRRDEKSGADDDGSARDPLDRLPGESSEKWKARVGSMLMNRRSV